MQAVLAYITVVLAVVFLVNKFFIPKKKKKGGCETNCGCS